MLGSIGPGNVYRESINVAYNKVCMAKPTYCLVCTVYGALSKLDSMTGCKKKKGRKLTIFGI